MRAIYFGIDREKNGKQVASYGFTYTELRDLEYGLDELVNYWRMWADDDRKDVRTDALNEIDKISELINKIEYYSNQALKIKEEQV